jgi:predicted ABC-type ATPase
MPKPILLVVAGCNGSGKSTFSNRLGEGQFDPFDYDFHFLKNYSKLLDIDIKDKMAHNMTRNELELQVNNAILNKSNFCYETNFNSTPLYWPQIFKDNGYEIRMTFLCLNSIEEAKRRVTIRVQNGGHFVPESEIEKRYFEGFSNLKAYYKFFDSIDLFDTSTYGEPPKFVLFIENGEVLSVKNIPEYLNDLISPNLL